MSRLFSCTVILGYFDSRLFTFPPFWIFKKLLFLWHWYPICSILWGFGFFVSFTSIKKQSSGSCLLSSLFYFISWPAVIPLRIGSEGRTNSLCLLGFLDFANSVLLLSDPGMFEQPGKPGKERWVPTGTASVFLQHTQDLGSRHCRLAPSSLCLPCWKGDWEAPVDWHF